MSRDDIKLKVIALRRHLGQQLALIRTSLGKRQVDWVREYPQFLVSSGQLSAYEAGKVFPPELFVMHLCKEHGLTMDWFYFGDDAAISFRTWKRIYPTKASSDP